MDHCHTHAKKHFDYLLWGTLVVILPAYLIGLVEPQELEGWNHIRLFSFSTVELVHRMWWGVLLGIAFVGLLDRVPREFVVSALGKDGGIKGILRATLAGVFLDLCSHGILLVGMKLYERGATLGQLMAFLIASPWNSLSLTLILWSLVGFSWMITFLLLSMVIAVISGLVFEVLAGNNKLPRNPNKIDIPDDFHFFPEAKKQLKQMRFGRKFFTGAMVTGIKQSRMILRWVFLGVVLASLLRAFMPFDFFQTMFGPSIVGLGMTLVVATIVEVCSEGSTPIAADILTLAHAPGNSFAFLMTGVSTDYTEIMSIKETTNSWKIALFLPLVTVPQVVLLGLLLNMVPV